MKLYNAKLISTTNKTLAYYCGLEGTLMVPPLGFSPRFSPDHIKFEVLTMSMLNSVEGIIDRTNSSSGVLLLELKTKNSVYTFEVKEIVDES